MPSITNFLIVSILITENLCNNVTGKYNTMDTKQFKSKTHRLLTFNTEQNGDISMELAFNVPFITIPVKKSVDMAKGAIANLNIGAVVLAGAIAFGFAVIIPGIALLISNKGHRRDDGYWWNYLSLLDQTLTENDIDTTSCVQKIICWTVQNSAENVKTGQSSSIDKIIEGLATNLWLQQIVEGTVFYDALQNGLDNKNCAEEYGQCKINQKSIQKITTKFVHTINNKKK